MNKITLIFALLWFQNSAFAEPIALRVEVTKQIATQYQPECEVENCIIWHNWYIFEAKVVDVLDGVYAKKTIRFAHLQHASWTDLLLKDMYIIVEEFTNRDNAKKLNSKYVAKHMTFPKEVVCYPEEIINSLPSKNKYRHASFHKSCFYAKKLIEMNE